MCTCASCVYTDGFKSRAAWPRGDPAGKRASESLYSAHVAYSRIWGRNHRAPEFPGGVSFAPLVYRMPKALDPHGKYTFPQFQEGMSTAAYALEFERENKLLPQISKSPVSRAQARPASPGKAPQHFRRRDRAPAAGAVYLKRGRPSLGVKRVLVTLDPASLMRGRELGAGNLSAGIRKALSV